MASLLPRASPIPRSITTGATPALTRLFSSTPSALSQRIPPESPLFINVPNPPQDQSIEARRELKPVKGFIPTPRRIFAGKGGPQKSTSAWFEQTAREPTSAKSQTAPGSDVQAWKRRMAANRRQNIRAGVRDLWARKQRLDTQRLASRTAKLAANRAAAMAPEREDERLTRGTVNARTLQTTVALDPDRFERARASAARTAALEAARSEARRDAIQALYMNARSFIVDEADLEAAVNDEFALDHFSSMGVTGAGYRVENIWDAHNEPPSVSTMVKELERSNSSVLRDFTKDVTRTVRRQKQVAEELTGGKMDSD
ncbi:hypothetical protein F5Y19DRAFT_75798 [Xylariaceae sp. FL1651]|nr:hypothetical protein F5Y19DRAFT_75798 [Xylariaceae sp. FL1651]